ncbi:MAG: NUDIX hydrolase [bacterium]
MRDLIRAMIAALSPLDAREAQDRAWALNWVDSGAGLYRLAKPATPDVHLVSYFLLVDGDYILLVDHIKAGLWLPTGGHVEPDEDPVETVRRECLEELGQPAVFLLDAPLMVTVTKTVGMTAGHTDVSLWFALQGERSAELTFDGSEFLALRWFAKDDVPFGRSDPELSRFLAKLHKTLRRGVTTLGHPTEL